MRKSDVDEIKITYEKYGFTEFKTKDQRVLAFTLKSGYYHNADIVPLEDESSPDSIFEQLKNLGYACKVRKFSGPDDLKKQLFNGFFSIESNKARFLREYDNFKRNIEESISEDASYRYVSANFTVNNDFIDKNLIEYVSESLHNDGPQLYLIEAAAGYGKTCTAFELLHNLLTKHAEKIPLFCELSRNRQAKIFRYVLLDEIDRSFPTLSSELVQSEIQNGNIIVILDGFDELLHKSSEDKERYENAEPMLETISELLNHNAKVILTSRRTAIFEGDEFSEWMNEHDEDFALYKVRLQTPNIQDWLTHDRIELLEEEYFKLENISNPVLLSYLRAIPIEKYRTFISSKDRLIDRYFESMMEREVQRQDLRLSLAEQKTILLSIANNMMDLDYTSEKRDYFIEFIVTYHKNSLESLREQYPRKERPSLDELANKLANHALLDRSDDDENSIGFVNEFVLGTFCAEIAVQQDDWTGDERFIDPMIMSFLPRPETSRKQLASSLQLALEFVEPTLKLLFYSRLLGHIGLEAEAETYSEIEFSNMNAYEDVQSNSILFLNCTFKEITFFLQNMTDFTFSNCRFFKCKVEHGNNTVGAHVLGCFADDSNFCSQLSMNSEQNAHSSLESSDDACRRHVLEAFLPVGKQNAHKRRPVKAICSTSKFPNYSILSEIEKLKKEDILFKPDKVSFLEINLGKMNEIRKILGRN